jgi:ABC-type cobalamin/Fe3+-siderophores transport system ATPase subunit
MRLRYLNLKKYPPIEAMEVCFASNNTLMDRECAIRFVVGLNGSGKSNLLRAIAEVFLALADERLPPFPVSLIYELGQRNKQDHYTFLVDCPGSKSDASLWVSQGFYFPEGTATERFANTVSLIRANTGSGPDGFSAFIAQGTWPQHAGIAMPKAVLAYTTGAMSPWRSVWGRNQDGESLTVADGDQEDLERPIGWTVAQELGVQAARQGQHQPAPPEETSTKENGLYRRPILLDSTLLKCALLAVALPESFAQTTDNENVLAANGVIDRAFGPDAHLSPLQKLLSRGGWHHLVSVVFRSRLYPILNDKRLAETASLWWYSAGEVISEPDPTKVVLPRSLYFDLLGPFGAEGCPVVPGADALTTCVTQGEALFALLGGFDSSAFERFTRMLELRQSGLFDDLNLRLRRQIKASTGDSMHDSAFIDSGVLRYEELSDGEQMVLGRMALFHLLQGQQDALLLLDEPETHFNDKWKREIVDIIDDAIGHTSNDVLISTHSAIVLSDVFNNEIVMVQKTQDGSTVRSVDEPTFATDPSALMMSVFGADDSIGKRAQEFIEGKLRQATGTPDEVADLERLIARMGSGFYRSELRTLLNTWRGGNA